MVMQELIHLAISHKNLLIVLKHFYKLLSDSSSSTTS
jgi:hypothetical protein